MSSVALRNEPTNDEKLVGGRLSIQMLSYRYRDPHVKDKTVLRPSYL